MRWRNRRCGRRTTRIGRKVKSGEKRRGRRRRRIQLLVSVITGFCDKGVIRNILLRLGGQSVMAVMAVMAKCYLLLTSYISLGSSTAVLIKKNIT